MVIAIAYATVDRGFNPCQEESFRFLYVHYKAVDFYSIFIITVNRKDVAYDLICSNFTE
jgi:hypothetical protein